MSTRRRKRKTESFPPEVVGFGLGFLTATILYILFLMLTGCGPHHPTQNPKDKQVEQTAVIDLEDWMNIHQSLEDPFGPVISGLARDVPRETTETLKQELIEPMQMAIVDVSDELYETRLFLRQDTVDINLECLSTTETFLGEEDYEQDE